MYEFEKNKLTAHLGDLYKTLKEYNCIIAGGMITSIFCNREINDVDVYFRNKQDLSDFIMQEVRNNSNMWIVAKTKKALLINYHDVLLQLIYFDTFDSPEAIFNTFDFYACMGAYDFTKEDFVLHDDFLKHNSQRILMFNSNTAYPIVSALRVDKYKQKGYTISKTEYLRVLLTCMQLNIDNYDDLKEQLGGMYGVDYDEIIKPEDGEQFDVAKIIDKMSKITLHKDYFKRKSPEPIDIGDWYIFIAESIKSPIKVYKHDGNTYTYNKEDGFSKLCDSEIEKYKDIIVYSDLVKDYFKGNLLFYKNVRKHDTGKLTSYYDWNFEYKVGEVAEGKGTKGWENKPAGLFVAEKDCVNESNYSERGDRVVVELKIDSVDDILDLEDYTLKKAKVIRIVPMEEIEKFETIDSQNIEIW